MNRNMGWELKPGFNQEQQQGGGDGSGDGGMAITWPTDGGSLSAPVQSPLTPEVDQGAENGSQGHQRSQEGGQGAQGQPGPVPYPRFQQVNRQAQQVPDLSKQVQEQSQTIAQLQSLVQSLMGEPGGQNGNAQNGADGETADEKKARLAEFYRDPKAYADNIKKELSKAISEKFSEAQAGVAYELDKRMVRQLHGDNSEVEQKMVEVIQGYGLKRLGAQQAVRAAYRLVTGQELPSSMAAAQNQGIRNRTQQPNQGGGQGGDDLTLETFQRMPLAEFAKDPQGYARRIMAAVTTQP